MMVIVELGKARLTVHDGNDTCFNFSGGVVALNFINTLWRRRHPKRSELLTNYVALLEFVKQADLLTADDIRALRELASESSGQAERVYDQAVEMRETFYRIFSAIAHDAEPEPADLEYLESWVGRAYQQASLVELNEHYDWDFSYQDDLRLPLWALATEAVELLRSENLRRVRECAAADCGWMFVDFSRNQSRRWCRMASCGNRAKAARYRAKHVRSES